MNTNHKKMIATLIREGRLAKGFTQKELSDLTNISVRSIQRIENEEIIPRSFTLKTLASSLDLPFASFTEQTAAIQTPTLKLQRFSKPQKLIASVGLSLIIILCAAVFVAQSARFPETHFEMFL